MRNILVVIVAAQVLMGCATVVKRGTGGEPTESGKTELQLIVIDETDRGRPTVHTRVWLQDPETKVQVFIETPWLMRCFGFDYNLSRIRELVHKDLWLRYKDSGYIPLHEVDVWKGSHVSYGMPVATSEWEREGNHYTASGYVPVYKTPMTREKFEEKYGREYFSFKEWKGFVVDGQNCYFARFDGEEE